MMQDSSLTNQYVIQRAKVAPIYTKAATLLHSLAPDQEIVFAAWLNGTPNLTALQQMTEGECKALVARLEWRPERLLEQWRGLKLTVVIQGGES